MPRLGERLLWYRVGLVGGVFVALLLVVWALADEVDGGVLARAGEGGVGPFAGEVCGAADDGGPGEGGALGAVSGQRVGVLEVSGRVVGVDRPRLAGVGLEDDRPVVMDCSDGGERAVIEVVPAVVAARDDAVTGGVFAAGDDRTGGSEGSVRDEPGGAVRLSRSRVRLSRVIITAERRPCWSWAECQASVRLTSAATSVA